MHVTPASLSFPLSLLASLGSITVVAFSLLLLLYCSVVDSTDTERLEIARAELHAMLEESDLDGVILLVFANKQDMKGALNAAQIGDALGLASIKDRPWSIQETSALAGRGLTEGFDWLVGAINSSGKA